jgi:hypothetical protein
MDTGKMSKPEYPVYPWQSERKSTHDPDKEMAGKIIVCNIHRFLQWLIIEVF